MKKEKKCRYTTQFLKTRRQIDLSNEKDVNCAYFEDVQTNWIKNEKKKIYTARFSNVLEFVDVRRDFCSLFLLESQ